MRTMKGMWSLCLMLGALVVGAPYSDAGSAQEAAPAFDADDIGGTVHGGAGPEAGVWVIAETTDLPVAFSRMVVTDDAGRYLLPDLPAANYRVWVRGYGLADSQPVAARPGQALDLRVQAAASAAAAAQVYPANYWFALVQPPALTEFPGTGSDGNGIEPLMQSRTDWIYHMKENCLFCHQFGTAVTRTLVPPRAGHDEATDAWLQRVFSVGDDSMTAFMGMFGARRAASMYADWTSRIAAGELPTVPPRPAGVERNVVVSTWDWAVAADGTPQFVHDEITTDQRNPHLNAGGRVYGVAQHASKVVWLDPRTHTTGERVLPTKFSLGALAGSAQPHNPMMDAQGRIWSTTFNRNPEDQPDWCKEGSQQPFARFFPLDAAIGRPSQVSVFDPATDTTREIDTCFGTHHLQFGYDDGQTLYLSGDSRVMGWVDTRKFDATGDSAASVGWCPMVIDTSGDGRIGESVARGEARLPTQDQRFEGFLYGMGVNPRDDSVWYAWYTDGRGGYGSPFFAIPGGIVRMERGTDAPATCHVELFVPPVDSKRERIEVFNPRGVDVGSDGIAWVAFGSGHLGRFDRSRCHTVHDAAGDGRHCPEGWEIIEIPGPQFKGVDRSGSTDWHYLVWVDEFNVLGLGHNVPIVPGTNSDSLIAYLPQEKRFVTLRVPYPLGFYARGLDGRIDDEKAGWKGRALWANYGSFALGHREGGDGHTRLPGKAVSVQLRPDPLAH
ncbi:MAG: carboxypeptidase regulatory-like domain-containing protein [Pseudomonadales bacterium]|jgi:hypothetical protein|nr:carboxypeptidase regulatory-like domain-containing protein [Pseudomonadales bacterium]